jgi:hypothetical protein
MSKSKELLDNLYKFYNKRYSGSDIEKKFNLAVKDLINTGDIEMSDYILFCTKNDIDPDTKIKSSSSSSSSSSSYHSDGCGSGGGYRTSHC